MAVTSKIIPTITGVLVNFNKVSGFTHPNSRNTASLCWSRGPCFFQVGEELPCWQVRVRSRT